MASARIRTPDVSKLPLRDGEVLRIVCGTTVLLIAPEARAQTLRALADRQAADAKVVCDADDTGRALQIDINLGR